MTFGDLDVICSPFSSAVTPALSLHGCGPCSIAYDHETAVKNFVDG